MVFRNTEERKGEIVMIKNIIVIIIVFFLTGCNTIKPDTSSNSSDVYSGNISMEDIYFTFQSNKPNDFMQSRATTLRNIIDYTEKIKLIQKDNKYSFSKHRIDLYPDLTIFFVYRIKDKEDSSMMVYSYFSFENPDVDEYLSKLKSGDMISSKEFEEMRIPMITSNGQRIIEFISNGEIIRIDLEYRDNGYFVTDVFKFPNEPNKKISEIAEYGFD